MRRETGSREDLTESQEVSKDVFLEVGTGFVPSSGREIKNRIYIGVDVSRAMAQSASYFTDKTVHGENSFFVNADGQRMPLRDGVVQTVLMKDVVGSPMEAPKKQGLLAEAKRVVNQEGQVVLVENVTPVPMTLPDGSRVFPDFPIESELEELGFDSRKITPDNEEWDQVQEQFIGKRAFGPNSYIIIAKVKKAS